MKNSNAFKFFLPIGLLCLSISFVVKHFLNVPDVFDGFCKGIGIGLILLALFSKPKKLVNY